MEKPSPSYDISSRLALKSRGDTEKNERYYDRMVIRGIAVLRDGDQETQAHVWRGDHSYSPDAATYSLMHFIEPEVAREHPDWTKVQVHEQAVDRFEKRLAQDLSYEHREIIHEESVVRWQPVETANGTIELATEYGDKMVTLSELWEHTKEYAEFAGNPAAYNREEHKAQLSMQDKLINGSSSGFVSVLSHPDAVRYVQVWQKSAAGDVISQHVDLYAATGKDFSPGEAHELIGHLSDFHNGQEGSIAPDGDNSYAHFFVTGREVIADDIRTIAVAQSVHFIETSYERKSVPIGRKNINVGFPVVADVADSLQKTGQYLRIQIEEKIRSIRRHGTELPVHHEQPVKSVQKKNNAYRQLPNAEQKKMVITEKKTVGVQNAEKTKSTDDVKVVLSEWWISQIMIKLVPMLPAASGATLYWFAMIEELSPGYKIAEAVSVHTKVPSNESRRTQAKASSVRDIWRAFVTRLTLQFTPAANESLTEKKTQPVTQLKKPNVQEYPVRVNEPERQISGEQAWATSFYEAMILLSKFFGSNGGSGESLVFTPVSDQQKPNLESSIVASPEKRFIPIGRFMFAWLLYRVLSVKPAETRTKKTEVTPGITAMKPDINEGKEQTPEQFQDTPWILFSIIWYLSMIRESGKAGNQASTQQQNARPKRKRKKAALPEHGVIFAFAS